MVTGELPVLVMSIQSSLGLGFVRTPDTDTHIDSVGAEGVEVGVKVCVAVNVAVGVCVIVGVIDGVNVREGNAVGVRVLVLVGTGVRVRVAEAIGVRVRVGVDVHRGVQDGNTKLVNVGKRVGDGLTVGV